MSSKKRRERRTFTEEFKRSAVDPVVNEGYSLSGAAKAVNANESSLRLWHKQFAPEPQACGPEASLNEVLEENKRLRKELREAQLEREILKKATAYFAKESQ